MEKLEPVHFVLPLVGILFALTTLVGFLRLRPRDLPLRLPQQPVDRFDWLRGGGIAAAFFLIAGWRLGVPNQPVFDEIYHARTGMEFVRGEHPFEWTHPHLAKLLIAASLTVFHGNFDPKVMGTPGHHDFTTASVIGWRFASLVFGTIALVLTYVLTRLITRNRDAATVAMGMLALDGVFFVMSRIAMTNIFTVAFILVASIGALRYRQTNDARWMLLLGVGLGCSVASRWTTLFALGLIFLWLAEADIRAVLVQPTRLLRLVPWYLLTFLLIPLAIYAATYIPYVRQGHTWKEVIDYQGQMWTYHTTLKATHAYSSPWWSWPLVLRPPWFHFSGGTDNRISGIWSIGNVFIWWASVPALGIVAWVARKVRSRELGFIAVMGLGLWLLWGAQSMKGGRQLIFLHYYFEAIPFACIALAYLGVLLWQKASVQQQNLLAGYGAAILFWFGFYYPLLSALPIPNWYMSWHIWEKGELWIR